MELDKSDSVDSVAILKNESVDSVLGTCDLKGDLEIGKHCY